MKSALRKLCARITWKALRVAGVPRPLETHEAALWVQGSHALRMRYGTPPPKDHPRYLNFFEARAFSQRGEDGMLLQLFEEIGTTDRRFVEFGVENGQECNCVNLAVNFGWHGLLMDGSEANVRAGRIFLDALIPDEPGRVAFVPCWITRENINAVLDQHGFSGEIDLLSIDIDGNDYWVWKAISCVRPRVVVIEYNASFGPSRSITTPYESAFDRWKKHPSGYYHGASLAALVKLGEAKGYVLVACSSWGANAFFVRRDVAAGRFQGLAASEAYIPQYVRLMKGHTTSEQYELIKHLPLEEV